jgi:spermidine/putrescine ABC transporter ATP-binding subunit
MDRQQPDVVLTNITKRYDGAAVVSDVSLAVAHGEFVSILGPSGCGKTTTLRMIAGFIRPDEGQVQIRGRVVNEVPPHRRDFAMVFQSYALFPHLSVRDNVAFGLRITNVAKREIAERVDWALGAVNLTGFERRLPRQLSGGQQQRVALARAIVMNPAVLLLDEPLSNLDLKMRQSMRLEIKQLQRRLNITTLFVTHDQEEALTMSDRIVVMNAGRIEQVGTPEQIYEHPRTAFVADFIGVTNLIEGSAAPAGTGEAEFRAPGGSRIRVALNGTAPEAASRFLIRPEKVRVSASPDPTSGRNVLPCTVLNVVYMGSIVRYYLDVGGTTIICDRVNLGAPELAVGEQGYASWAPEDGALLTA